MIMGMERAAGGLVLVLLSGGVGATCLPCKPALFSLGVSCDPRLFSPLYNYRGTTFPCLLLGLYEYSLLSR